MTLCTFKILCVFIIITLTNISGFCQDNISENESSESILQREEYKLVKRAGGPGKVLPPDTYEKAVIQMRNIPEDRNIPGSSTSFTGWQSVNPTGMFYARTNENYISGRTNSIAFHPTDPNIFYIAAAQGGVWKTIDGGINWTVLTDNIGSIASGDIAIDPNNPNTLYYGTGELNYSGDSQYGDGIYKSTNAGLNWIQISTASLTGLYTGKIIVDPSNSNIVFAAGNIGVFRSTNAGINWLSILQGNFTSLVIDPVSPNILYAGTGSGQSFIYKTTNSGSIWETVSSLSSGRRTQLAISPDNPNVLYASIAGTSGALFGLYRTTNAGVNWTEQNSSTNYMSSQGWYDNAVTVIPGNPNGVVVAGLDVYVSTDGGVTLTKKSNWSTSSTLNFSHADIHYLTYNGSVLYCCSDGGLYFSFNNADSWDDLNENISTLQFVSADYDPTDLRKLYGGCQDNNKQTSTNTGVVWIQRTTGDGGYTIVDPVNTNYVYGQYVNGSIQRSDNFGVSFTNITPSGSSGGLFYNPYEMAPGDHNTIVFGRADVWKTESIQTASTSSGWSQIAATGIINGNVSAIGISKSNIDKIYIGTSNGKILVTTDNGNNWSTTSGYPYVSDFWVDHDNDDICYASFAGATAGKHVYKTTDGGSSWFSITSNLPNIAANSIVKKQSTPQMLFAGTDLGVFQSTNDGVNWINFNSGMPNIEVRDLKYKEDPNVLMAASYGRGCFMFDLGMLVGIEENTSIPEKFSLSQNYPNPFNPVTKIKYEIPESGFVTLKIYDVLGNEVEELFSGNRNAGSYVAEFSADKSRSNIASGVYYYKLTAGEFSDVKSMILLK
ncbi:MAG TPA: T9SS type A sorting domain-containing protein [Ignavibacteria bacterium]|nr:T9SS type A sorting domain-containing protein [Ignavibacteria bacterium]